MRSRRRALLGAFAAVAALSTGTGGAAALRSLAFSPGGAARAISSALTITGSGQSIICSSTLSLELERSIPKTAGALVGRVTRVEVGRPETCTKTSGIRSLNGFRLELTLPWHVRYQTILGTLPRITGVLLVILRLGWLWDFTDVLGRNFRCLFEPDLGILAAVEAERVRSFRILVGQTFRGRELAPGRCPETFELSGEFRLEPAQEVRLL